ncbi:hypothetical protein [Halocynthiibacter styelae]|uniref:Uncharacterized protein n=1 Tax=Halocynthiibacter styelae TaxID=2761955 RepID=A0A8J7LWH2_9RHOB|nr:hypothetical protein [Paenihalocynthiibacter styelae]MBI1494377.1 hypothetical protein [Paenihalocynthiibacter styelae]
MTYTHENFTMSFREAMDLGIDYRDYDKVDRLPQGILLTAVAGIWGDFQNIRCLFVDRKGNRYLRNIQGGNGMYPIKELRQRNARTLTAGQIVRLNRSLKAGPRISEELIQDCSQCDEVE